MKTLKFLLLVLVMAGTTSCVIEINDPVYGSGIVVSEVRDVSGFDRLRVSSGIDVVIRQGDMESLEVEADDNLMEHIRTEVVDGTLKIHTDKNIRRAKRKVAYLEYRDITDIRISSAGDVKGVNTLKTESLSVDISSAGDLDLDVEVEEIRVDISSSGDARISGSADRLRADLSSAGDLFAYDLVTKQCNVSCSSAGDARVHATEEFNLRCSSAGNIYYKGDGALVSSRTSSAGSIIKRRSDQE